MASRGLGTLTLSLVTKVGGFVGPLSQAERELDKRTKAMVRSAKVAGAAIGTAFVTAGTAIVGLTANAINFAENVNDIRKKVGLSAETISAWGYAAQQSGSDIESLSSALPKFAKNIADAADSGSEIGRLFKTLGVDVKDSTGTLRGIEDILPEVADRFASLEDGTTKTALAMQLFGKSGAELIQFLNNGSDGLDDLTERARRLGVVVGDDTAQAADDFKDKLSDLKAISLGFGLDLAQRLLPALNDTVDKLVDVAKEGSLAANAVEVISAAFSAGVGVLSQYNRAVASLSIEIERVVNSAKGLSTTVASLSIGGLLSGKGPLERLKNAKSGIGQMLAADAEARKQWEKLNAPTAQKGMFSDVTATTEFVSASEQKRLHGLQARLNGFFAGAGKSNASRSGGKSDAEREADRLLASYKQLKASLTEQADLYGVTGEAARLRYEIEHGELSKLTQAQKDDLIARAERLDMLNREKDLQETLDLQTESFNEMNDAILEQIGYLGMTNDEHEIALNLARAGVAAESERGKIIAANTQALQTQRAQMEDQIAAMDAIRDAGSDFLSDWVSGSKSFKDAALDALDSIYDRITQMISENLMDQLFGKRGDPVGGSAGGWLGNLFGGLFSNGSGATASGGTDMATNIAEWFGGGRASGGAVNAGMFYRVNENGPELLTVGSDDYLMMGSRGGRVSSAAGRGSSSLTQNFIVQGAPDRRTREQMARDSGRAAARGISRTGR